MADASIHDVSDTAIWVAHFRAEETKRPDALFRDVYAARLVGDRGEAIASSMAQTSAYTRQNVVIRTYIIDKFIEELIARGVDTFVNVGAGLDTRPYRMNLPASIRWIEIDYPHMMEFKASALASEKPNVSLERISLDLADRPARQAVFAKLNQGRVAILTEGVLPYLSEGDVDSLSRDLMACSAFEFWICDYMSPDVYKFLKEPRRVERMKNAPFKFFPENPFGFFAGLGWKVDEIRYIQMTSNELGRRAPMPWFARLLKPFMPPAIRERFQKVSGYMILKRA